MTMHLEGPWLSTIGKSRGKQKWASAEHKKRALELAQSEAELRKRWNILVTPPKSTNRVVTIPGVVTKPYRRGSDAKKIPSIDTGATGAISSSPRQMYTGTKMLGIGTLHKSNAVPVFSEDEAADMARMRR